MANYIIKVGTDEIRRTTDRFKAQQSVMEGYMTEMKTKIDDLQNYFKSDAGRMFVEKYNNVHTDIKACLDNLEKEITGLRNAANIFDPVINKVDTDVSGLSTTGAFKNTSI